MGSTLRRGHPKRSSPPHGRRIGLLKSAGGKTARRCRQDRRNDEGMDRPPRRVARIESNGASKGLPGQEPRGLENSFLNSDSAFFDVESISEPRRKECGNMLWIIFMVLLVLWLLGLATAYTIGGLIHLLLVIALVVLAINIVQGRRAL